MAKYKIEVKKSAVKEFKRIPSNDLKRLINIITSLKENPRPSGCVKLSSEELYRIKKGKYRVLYQIKDDILMIIIVKISHRKDVYK